MNPNPSIQVMTPKAPDIKRLEEKIVTLQEERDKLKKDVKSTKEDNEYLKSYIDRAENLQALGLNIPSEKKQKKSKEGGKFSWAMKSKSKSKLSSADQLLESGKKCTGKVGSQMLRNVTNKGSKVVGEGHSQRKTKHSKAFSFLTLRTIAWQ